MAVLSALSPLMSPSARFPFYLSDIVNRLRGMLIEKCFIGHTFYHLYLIVIQTLYMCFKQ